MAARIPTRTLARAAIVAAALIGLVLLIDRARAMLERRAEITETQRMRTRLLDLRSRVESCQVAVERERQAFDRYRGSVDSLRAEVQEFEALDDLGVPAERYEEYLEVFDRYNESIPGWQARADSLETHAEACRTVTVEHNELADSLRGRLEGRGRSPVE